MGHKRKQIEALCCPAGHQFTKRHSQVGAQSQRTFSRQAVQTPGLGTAVRIIFPCHLPSMGHRWLLEESSPWHSNGFTWFLQQLLGHQAPGPLEEGLNPMKASTSEAAGNQESRVIGTAISDPQGRSGSGPRRQPRSKISDGLRCVQAGR